MQAVVFQNEKHGHAAGLQGIRGTYALLQGANSFTRFE
jgi:hypothetical protein